MNILVELNIFGTDQNEQCAHLKL